MGDKINDGQVADLLALLRTDASIESKVTQITNIKSGIKQNNVPDSCVTGLFEVTRLSMSSQQAALVHAGFTTLHYLLSRLASQEPKYIAREAPRTLTAVIDKIGDHKEKYRVMAAQCLTTFWKAAPMDVERTVKMMGMAGKNPRAKEASMLWLVQMHEQNGLQFRGFVPTLMELLEDADGMVRDSARNTVIELFENASNTARSDLKKQLKIFNVRPAIVAAIMSHLNQANSLDTDSLAQADRPMAPHRYMSNSVPSLPIHAAAARPATPVIETKVEQVDPAYVNTQRELEETFRDMHPYFEGKESEQNWLKREQSCTKLRKLNAGNAAGDYRDAWLTGVRSLLDGILKAVNSLRTSLSKEGCLVVQEVTKTAGPGMDTMVEILLQNLIKLCGGTKKIASQAGDTTVDVIISKVTYSIRIMQHIWLACQDKNVQPRTYAAGWLKTLLKKEVHHKGHLEHTGGLDLVEKCIKRGLADANPGVRERMRGTYWTFALMWPAKAEAIMATLDGTQQKLLENDPNNPNSPKRTEIATTRPGMGLSKSTVGPPKPSLRETVLAQKKAAMAAKNLPTRPGSAMSSFSPVKANSASSVSSVPATKSDAPVSRHRPESSATGHGGLSVAPMRPTKSRRPEIARPATAGPYSIRRPPHGSASVHEASSTSPSGTAIHTRTPSFNTSPIKKTGARPNTSQSNHSQSSHASPSKDQSGGRIPMSPRASPRPKPAVKNVRIPSSPKNDEDITMVLPNVGGLTAHKANDSSPSPPAKALQVYEDPFSATDDQTTSRPAFTVPVLEEVPVNEDASNLMRTDLATEGVSKNTPVSAERSKQISKLLDSGISRIKAKTLDVHGFRKLQALIRENKALWTDDRFDALLLGLFEYLEAPLVSLSPEKIQDVKAQTLTTINLMLNKSRDDFQPYVPQALQSLLKTRSAYDARAHIVSGLEVLAKELVTLGDHQATTNTVTTILNDQSMSLEGCRILSMGLHILKELLGATSSFVPSKSDMDKIGKLAVRCLDSSDSGVRMEATHLCVAMHTRVGEDDFWRVMSGVKDDPKNLVTYYIVKRQRGSAAA